MDVEIRTMSWNYFVSLIVVLGLVIFELYVLVFVWIELLCVTFILRDCLTWILG